MVQIKKACESYNFGFAQNIKILPGTRACRVLDSKKVKEAGDVAAEEPIDHLSRILNQPVVINESKKNSSDLQREIDTLQHKVNNLKDNLHTLLKFDLVTKLTAEIKTIKVELTSEYKDEVMKKLKAAKKKRHDAYLAIQKCRSSKSALNQELYY
ncbi:hypothetical protein RMATCC62417_18437 [Rhizopus microsporus]|nr:hypothetical protein RMATCC62417_18437 [Rhizopus microsporus]